MNAQFGVYIHFPFCITRCPYCDFGSSSPRDIPHIAYANAVIADLEKQIRWNDWSNREVLSIYFGGGTPSLWSPRQVCRIIETILKLFPSVSHPEITIEANPELLECSKLADLRDAGANRVSFGIQSSSQHLLDALGRRHTRIESLTAVDTARDAGFEEISLDLIYGISGQNTSSAIDDACFAIETSVEHISAYCLTLHPGTRMYKEVLAGQTTLPDEDETIDIEDSLIRKLEREGFERYEISNLAKNGKVAIHNTGYWTGRECLALGAGAHGLFLKGLDAQNGGIRYYSSQNPFEYIQNTSTKTTEDLDPYALLKERLFLGMRMRKGVNLKELRRWSGLDPMNTHKEVFQALQEDGLIEIDGDRLVPTALGFRLNDTLAGRIGC